MNPEQVQLSQSQICNLTNFILSKLDKQLLNVEKLSIKNQSSLQSIKETANILQQELDLLNQSTEPNNDPLFQDFQNFCNTIITNPDPQNAPTNNFQFQQQQQQQQQIHQQQYPQQLPTGQQFQHFMQPVPNLEQQQELQQQPMNQINLGHHNSHKPFDSFEHSTLHLSNNTIQFINGANNDSKQYSELFNQMSCSLPKQSQHEMFVEDNSHLQQQQCYTNFNQNQMHRQNKFQSLQYSTPNKQSQQFGQMMEIIERNPTYSDDLSQDDTKELTIIEPTTRRSTQSNPKSAERINQFYKKGGMASRSNPPKRRVPSLDLNMLSSQQKRKDLPKSTEKKSMSHRDQIMNQGFQLDSSENNNSMLKPSNGTMNSQKLSSATGTLNLMTRQFINIPQDIQFCQDQSLNEESYGDIVSLIKETDRNLNTDPDIVQLTASTPRVQAQNSLPKPDQQEFRPSAPSSPPTKSPQKKQSDQFNIQVQSTLSQRSSMKQLNQASYTERSQKPMYMCSDSNELEKQIDADDSMFNSQNPQEVLYDSLEQPYPNPNVASVEHVNNQTTGTLDSIAKFLYPSNYSFKHVEVSEDLRLQSNHASQDNNKYDSQANMSSGPNSHNSSIVGANNCGSNTANNNLVRQQEVNHFQTIKETEEEDAPTYQSETIDDLENQIKKIEGKIAEYRNKNGHQSKNSIASRSLIEQSIECKSLNDIQNHHNEQQEQEEKTQQSQSFTHKDSSNQEEFEFKNQKQEQLFLQTGTIREPISTLDNSKDRGGGGGRTMSEREEMLSQIRDHPYSKNNNSFVNLGFLQSPTSVANLESKLKQEQEQKQEKSTKQEQQHQVNNNNNNQQQEGQGIQDKSPNHLRQDTEQSHDQYSPFNLHQIHQEHHPQIQQHQLDEEYKQVKAYYASLKQNNYFVRKDSPSKAGTLNNSISSQPSKHTPPKPKNAKNSTLSSSRTSDQTPTPNQSIQNSSLESSSMAPTLTRDKGGSLNTSESITSSQESMLEKSGMKNCEIVIRTVQQHPPKSPVSRNFKKKQPPTETITPDRHRSRSAKMIVYPKNGKNDQMTRSKSIENFKQSVQKKMEQVKARIDTNLAAIMPSKFSSKGSIQYQEDSIEQQQDSIVCESIEQNEQVAYVNESKADEGNEGIQGIEINDNNDSCDINENQIHSDDYDHIDSQNLDDIQNTIHNDTDTQNMDHSPVDESMKLTIIETQHQETQLTQQTQPNEQQQQQLPLGLIQPFDQINNSGLNSSRRSSSGHLQAMKNADSITELAPASQSIQEFAQLEQQSRRTSMNNNSGINEQNQLNAMLFAKNSTQHSKKPSLSESSSSFNQQNSKFNGDKEKSFQQILEQSTLPIDECQEDSRNSTYSNQNTRDCTSTTRNTKSNTNRQQQAENGGLLNYSLEARNQAILEQDTEEAEKPLIIETTNRSELEQIDTFGQSDYSMATNKGRLATLDQPITMETKSSFIYTKQTEAQDEYSPCSKIPEHDITEEDERSPSQQQQIENENEGFTSQFCCSCGVQEGQEDIIEQEEDEVIEEFEHSQQLAKQASELQRSFQQQKNKLNGSCYSLNLSGSSSQQQQSQLKHSSFIQRLGDLLFSQERPNEYSLTFRDKQNQSSSLQGSSGIKSNEQSLVLEKITPQHFNNTQPAPRLNAVVRDSVQEYMQQSRRQSVEMDNSNSNSRRNSVQGQGRSSHSRRESLSSSFTNQQQQFIQQNIEQDQQNHHQHHQNRRNSQEQIDHDSPAFYEGGSEVEQFCAPQDQQFDIQSQRADSSNYSSYKPSIVFNVGEPEIRTKQNILQDPSQDIRHKQAYEILEKLLAVQESSRRQSHQSDNEDVQQQQLSHRQDNRFRSPSGLANHTKQFSDSSHHEQQQQFQQSPQNQKKNQQLESQSQQNNSQQVNNSYQNVSHNNSNHPNNNTSSHFERGSRSSFSTTAPGSEYSSYVDKSKGIGALQALSVKIQGNLNTSSSNNNEQQLSYSQIHGTKNNNSMSIRHQNESRKHSESQPASINQKYANEIMNLNKLQHYVNQALETDSTVTNFGYEIQQKRAIPDLKPEFISKKKFGAPSRKPQNTTITQQNMLNTPSKSKPQQPQDESKVFVESHSKQKLNFSCEENGFEFQNSKYVTPKKHSPSGGRYPGSGFSTNLEDSFKNQVQYTPNKSHIRGATNNNLSNTSQNQTIVVEMFEASPAKQKKVPSRCRF